MKTDFLSRQFTKVAPYLYRTGAGVYYGKVKREGKLHRQSLETEDFITAKRKLKDFISDVEKKNKEVPDITFEEAGNLWLASLYDLKGSSKTRREVCLNMINPAFKGRKLRSITKHDLNEWAAKRAKEASARTFNLDRETLVLLMDYAKKTLGIIDENHAKELPKMKQKRSLVMPPTREQFAELIAFLDQSKRLSRDNPARNAALFVRFLAYTGVRLDEARNVRWQDVDFSKDTMRVTGGDEGTKNHSERKIPLFPPVRELLALFAKDQRKTHSPIFEIVTAKEVLKTASKAIGLPEGEHFGHHDMRHFFCSNAIELLIPDHVIAGWLGHRDGGVLVKTTYGHLRQSYSDAEALKMTFSS